MIINTISHSAWTLLLVLIVSKRGKAALNIKPTDATVLLSGSTFFNCSTFNFSSNSEDIVWYHYSVGSDKRNDVYDDGEVFTNYKSRFRGETDLSKGVVNLIVEAPTLEDAGTYECQDRKGVGEFARAQLIVLETEPICKSNIQPDGVIGSNDCEITPDQVEMSCNIPYRGNNHVQLELRNNLENDKSSLTVQCSNTTTRSTCKLTVAGDRTTNNSVFICQTKDTGAKVYNCASDVVRLLYAKNNNTTISKTSEEEFRCSANSSQYCSYTWYSDGKNISESESLKANRSGLHVCKANCRMRGLTCLVTAGSFNVSGATTPEETSKAGLIAGILLAIVAIIIIALVVWWCQCKKRNDNENQAKDRAKLENGRPSEQIKLLQLLESERIETDADGAIQRSFDSANYIGQGLRVGEIRGPIQYGNINRTCERIMCTLEEQTPINGTEMTKQEEILNKCLEWKNLNHDNVIRFYAIVVGLNPQALFIIMDHTEGGSVREALKKCTESRVNLPIAVIINWALQIAEGMEHLHNNGIVHGNLTSVQILVEELFEAHDISNKTLKISRFCLADNNLTSQAEMKFAFVAPEVFKGICGKESDSWSFGIVIWEILTRRIAYQEQNSMDKIRSDICKGAKDLEIPDSCPKELLKILKGCRRLECSKRPSFSEILECLRTWHLVHSPA